MSQSLKKVSNQNTRGSRGPGKNGVMHMCDKIQVDYIKKVLNLNSQGARVPRKRGRHADAKQ